jgi:hypothetical protein
VFFLTPTSEPRSTREQYRIFHHFAPALGGVGQPGSIAITPLFYIFDNRRNKASGLLQ